MKKVLEIKKLTKYYGNKLGVKDLSLSLEKGDVFGFIGPNGAGKSTTIRSIMNLINKTSGEVYCEGEKLEKDNLKQKAQIGYLPSEIHLYDDLTVKEILDYHESFYKKNIHKRRQELVKRLKLEETEKIEELSLGNLKKIGIILAFMHEPKLLILDEATSGLDPIIQEVFYELLEEEKAKGTTIFYSTHILSEVSRICNRVGIIKNGELLKEEQVKDLTNKELTFITITSQDVNKIVKKLNITPQEQSGNTIKIKNTLEINELIKILAKYKIEKLLIEPATLEEIFLHYYK